MKLNDRVKETIEFELNEAANGGKTLGVHVRATDFNQGYNRHPVAVSPAEYLDIAKKPLQRESMKRSFWLRMISVWLIYFKIALAIN